MTKEMLIREHHVIHRSDRLWDGVIESSAAKSRKATGSNAMRNAGVIAGTLA